MIHWGMVGNSHDASLAVFETRTTGLSNFPKTKLLHASLAKDYSQVQNDPNFNGHRSNQLDKLLGRHQKYNGTNAQY
jgi:hypothetical protein